MRKALLEKEYETGKRRVIKYGRSAYTAINGQIVVDLTDWPILNSQKAVKDDVYYSDIPIDGRYFHTKWLNFNAKETHLKKEKIYNIATKSYIEGIMYGIKTRHELELGAGLSTTLTASEYVDFANWTGVLAVLHKTFDLSTITLNDIYFGNTDIFPEIPHPHKLNGF